MNDFVNSTVAPSFDTDGIVRRARRKRATAVAGIAAALVLAGGGTALATATSGSSAPKPAASTTVSTARAATVLYQNHDVVIPLELGGINLEMAKMQFLKAQLKLGTVTKANCEGKPGAVIKADPHSPKIVSRGDTVNLTLCSG